MMSWDRRIVILFVSLLLFGGFICAAGGYNIALHAQLFPGDGKVVGSVLTTDGLRSAFALRYDVDRVDVFYPSNYKGFLDHEWDLILVEGWFPTIETFVLIARSNFPLSRIVFLCLDPVYPGLDIVKKFDVDAIISNSKVLVEEFRHDFPTDFMLLAANPDEMKPLTNVSRVWGAVYVGAGGQMLQFKPELRQLLIDSIPFGLRLHGSSWESATAGPLLGDIAQGSLPRYDLASAYASAHAVLASTIQSQAAFDMINNRIFEALSCGAVVITHAHLSSALESLHCDAILFVNETHSVAHHLAALTTKLDGNVQEGGGRDCGVQAQVDSDAAHTDAGTAASTGTGTRASRTSVCPRMPTTFGSSSYADNLRHVARNFILRSHTWSHRAVQILDFYHSLVNANPASSHPSLLSSTTTTTTTIPTTTSSSSSSSSSNSSSSSSSSSSVASTDTRKPDRGRRRRQNAPRMVIVVSAHLAGHADYIFVVSRAIRHLQQLYRVDLAQYFSAAEGDTSYADAATDFEIVKLCGGRSVAGTLLTSACQSYLQQYDLLLSVVTPFDALDVFMQQLPPVRMRRHLRSATVNATSAQLMQKRAAYIIGFDAALLSSRSSSGGGGGGGVGSSSYRHYDVIWYRSAFELQLLREALGAVGWRMPPDNRLQHMFGVGKGHDDSIRSDDRNIPSSSSETLLKIPGRTVMVCFYQHHHLCTTANRMWHLHNSDSVFEAETVDGSARGMHESQAVLLLIGGSWDQWLSLPNTLPTESLPYTSHFRDGVTGNAVSLIHTAQRMLLFLPSALVADFSTTADNASSNVGESAPKKLVPVLQTTQSDILWPFVAAAVGGTEIYLTSGTHPHLMHLVEEGCALWTHSDYMLREGLKYGLDRLHGFGSVHSGVRVVESKWEQQAMREDDEGLWYTAGDGVNVSMNVKNMFQEAAQTIPQFPTSVHVLRMHFDYFHMGTDGECCIQRSGTVAATVRSSAGGGGGGGGGPAAESLSVQVLAEDVLDPGWICLMRHSYRALVLEFRTPSSTEDSIKCVDETVCLLFQLRGSFYGDTFFEQEVCLKHPRPATNQNFSDHSKEWFENNGYFVYVVNVC